MAADTAVKSAHVEIGFMDRFCGSLIITGGLAEVETAVEEVLRFFREVLGFQTCEIQQKLRSTGDGMKKIFLMGRSEAGKTSLTQALKGEELHYVKTQYTTTEDDTIDSPGEYAESKRFSVGLACFSFEG